MATKKWRKRLKKLEARRADYEAMNPSLKATKAFHKPGSQSGRK